MNNQDQIRAFGILNAFQKGGEGSRGGHVTGHTPKGNPIYGSPATHIHKQEESKRLAPNGKESNLSEKQYKAVRTPEFKAWFGDWENDPKNASKVVDENGEPLVVYHGTDNSFNEFDINKTGTNTGNAGHYGYGAYFSDDKQEALGYGKILKEVFLNIKKPFLHTDDSFKELQENGISDIDEQINLSIDFDSLYNEINKIDPIAGKLLLSMKEHGYEKGWDEFLKNNSINKSKLDLNDISDIFIHSQNNNGVPDYIIDYLKEYGVNEDKIKYKRGYEYQQSLHWITDLGKRSKEVTEVMKKLKYDGVIAGSEYVSFNPNQIKSADNNKTFDSKLNDINKGVN